MVLKTRRFVLFLFFFLLVAFLKKISVFPDFVFTENVITSMIGLFLSAGLDPVATTVTFCLYELAYHPEIQDRLFQEIQTVRNECGDEIGFEDLKKLQYLEQVVNGMPYQYACYDFYQQFEEKLFFSPHPIRE